MTDAPVDNIVPLASADAVEDYVLKLRAAQELANTLECALGGPHEPAYVIVVERSRADIRSAVHGLASDDNGEALADLMHNLVGPATGSIRCPFSAMPPLPG